MGHRLHVHMHAPSWPLHDLDVLGGRSAAQVGHRLQCAQAPLLGDVHAVTTLQMLGGNV